MLVSQSPTVWGTFIRDYSIHAAILLVFIWLIRPKKSVLGQELLAGSISIRTHAGMRVLAAGVGVLGFFFTLLCLALLQSPDGIEWGVVVPCMLMSIGMLLWVWKAFTFRIEADQTGIRYKAAFRRVLATWQDLESIQFKSHPGVYIIATRAGGIPVATTLENVPLLFKLVQLNRPDLFQGSQASPIVPVNE